MSEPRVVTPHEAQRRLALPDAWHEVRVIADDLAHTLATEPERIRAAVVEALRNAQYEYERKADMASEVTGRTLALAFADVFRKRADAIENGADW